MALCGLDWRGPSMSQGLCVSLTHRSFRAYSPLPLLTVDEEKRSSYLSGTIMRHVAYTHHLLNFWSQICKTPFYRCGKRPVERTREAKLSFTLAWEDCNICTLSLSPLPWRLCPRTIVNWRSLAFFGPQCCFSKPFILISWFRDWFFLIITSAGSTVQQLALYSSKGQAASLGKSSLVHIHKLYLGQARLATS